MGTHCKRKKRVVNYLSSVFVNTPGGEGHPKKRTSALITPNIQRARSSRPPTAYYCVFVMDSDDDNNVTCINVVSPRPSIQDYLLTPSGEGINGLLAHLGVGSLDPLEGISTHLEVNLIYIIKNAKTYNNSQP